MYACENTHLSLKLNTAIGLVGRQLIMINVMDGSYSLALKMNDIVAK